MSQVVACHKCDDEVVVGEDYRSHLLLNHDESDYENILSLTLAKTSNESFKSIFNRKLKEIREVMENPTVVIEDDKSEDKEYSEDHLWQMFEDINNKVANLDLNIENEDTVVDNDDVEKQERVADNHDQVVDEKIRWFEGTFYVCKSCSKKVFGETQFKAHLKKDHSIVVKSVTEFSKYFSHFERKQYKCKICDSIYNHDYKNIYCHMKKAHRLSIQEYEQIHEKKQETKKQNDENLNPKARECKIKILSKNEVNQILVPSLDDTSTNDLVAEITEVVKDNSTTIAPVDPILINTVEEQSGDSEVTALKTEPMDNIPKQKTTYFCPLQNVKNSSIACGFSCSKKDFRDNAAGAKHLINVHKVKGSDMKKGQFKFNKVKTEMKK